MASDRGVTSLAERIQAAIDYHAKEFDMTVAEGVGVLECIKFRPIAAAEEDEEDEEPVA